MHRAVACRLAVQCGTIDCRIIMARSLDLHRTQVQLAFYSPVRSSPCGVRVVMQNACHGSDSPIEAVSHARCPTGCLDRPASLHCAALRCTSINIGLLRLRDMDAATGEYVARHNCSFSFFRCLARRVCKK